jgi:GNAT superfamily N-acetyltransferase
MTPAPFLIRRATEADAARLAAYAARAFEEAFGQDNSPGDMAMYLDATYSQERQRDEIRNPDMATLLVEHDGDLVAFAQVRRGPAPPCVTLFQPVEVWRFYVGRAWHGRGVAQALMQDALDAAAALGGRSAWLSVWERNPRAIAFYGKCGFADAGTTVFLVGTDRQTDRVMAVPLPV